MARKLCNQKVSQPYHFSYRNFDRCNRISKCPWSLLLSLCKPFAYISLSFPGQELPYLGRACLLKFQLFTSVFFFFFFRELSRSSWVEHLLEFTDPVSTACFVQYSSRTMQAVTVEFSTLNGVAEEDYWRLVVGEYADINYFENVFLTFEKFALHMVFWL